MENTHTYIQTLHIRHKIQQTDNVVTNWLQWERANKLFKASELKFFLCFKKIIQNKPIITIQQKELGNGGNDFEK